MLLRSIVAGLSLALVCQAAEATSRRQRPATSLIITNARAVPATEMGIHAGGTLVTLPGPLAPGARATLQLPRLTGCIVEVGATFADEAIVHVVDFDVCREKTIRFTE